MKILHVLDHSLPLHSGYTFRTRSILREQRRLGWETCHLTSTKQGQSPKDQETFEDLLFYRTPMRIPALSRVPLINQYTVISDLRNRLAEIINLEKPDLVHAHSPCLTALAAAPVCRKAGIRLVYEVRSLWEDAAVSHGTTHFGSARYRLSRWLETQALRRADAITTICLGLAEEITSRGINPDKVTVIPNAVDADKFPFRHAADQNLINQLQLSGKTIFGFIGSFYGYEGLDSLIAAMPEVLEKLPQAHLLLVGGGPEDQALKRLAQTHGVQAAVTFTGRVPHDQVSSYYSIIDVLCYPRKPIRLTEMVTPLKPLEAMAMGKVLIASDIGGHRELITDSETGFLFAAGTVSALGACMVQTAEQRQNWDKITTQARTYVEKQRSWTRSVDGYHKAYGI